MDGQHPPLFGACVLPGCSNPVAATGDACSQCRMAFGDMLTARPDLPPLTAQQIEQRDSATALQYAVLKRREGQHV